MDVRLFTRIVVCLVSLDQGFGQSSFNAATIQTVIDRITDLEKIVKTLKSEYTELERSYNNLTVMHQDSINTNLELEAKFQAISQRCSIACTTDSPKPTDFFTKLTTRDTSEMAPNPAICRNKWSQWINRVTPTPDYEGGDNETMTSIEKWQFCPVGRITQVECQNIVGIQSYSTGEIMTCSLGSGAVCRNMDNWPLPCNDYEIRYFCDCQAVGNAGIVGK